MSTLWTPDGERPIRRESPATPEAAAQAADQPQGDEGAEEMDAEMQARMIELSEQMANTPAEVIIANHAYGLFELAALHLSLPTPQLEQARMAIDAFAVLVEGMAGRLGEAEAHLNGGLAQLRLAFVEISRGASASEAEGGNATPA